MQALRRIYGQGFFLIGVVAAEEERKTYLRERRGCSSEEIARLLSRDDHEGDTLGQRTRDTFHLADVFVPLGDTKELGRFLRLVFGHPYETPTRDEYAMFLAFCAALRSADLSRHLEAMCDDWPVGFAGKMSTTIVTKISEAKYVSLTCTFDGAAGKGTLPAKMLGKFPPSGKQTGRCSRRHRPSSTKAAGRPRRSSS